MIEIEVYLHNHFLKVIPNDPERQTKILLFLRDKQSGSAFPIAFQEEIAAMVLNATSTREDLSLDGFTLIQRIIEFSRGTVKLAKATIYEIKNDQFLARLHFLVDGEEKIERVDTSVALGAALRAGAPITVSEEVFIEAIQMPDAERITSIIRSHENED